jgi:hypothetical protein
MGDRTRKLSVQAEMRREWLRRNEEDGESPPQIAAKDMYDVRTVRKQIGLAKEERETREARAFVLRNALESHYDDLRRYAEFLDSQVLGTQHGHLVQDSEFIETALRQHLPRSPIWGLLLRLERLRQESYEQMKGIEDVTIKAIEADSDLNVLAQTGLKGIAAAVSAIMNKQVSEWSQGNPGLDLNNNLNSEPAEGGLVSLRLGLTPMGQVKAEDAEECKETIGGFLQSLESRLRESEEYGNLEKTTADIERTRRKLREELAIIRLRRVVPGRCKYCPPW